MLSCPVNSHNEWDPLEEVIVGELTNATIPGDHAAEICGAPRAASALQPLVAGMRYPEATLRHAQHELNGFITLLEAEGVRVRRPKPQPFQKRFATPRWSSHGYSCAAPRDSLLVIGSEIIEAPQSWRSRYFETFAYRELLKEYFEAGARWTSAPKPELPDDLYDRNYMTRGSEGFILTEHEPVFDAADFIRCDRDLFAIRSNTTNRAGIDWLRRHLNSRADSAGYFIHEIPIRNRHAMHIDLHFMPLAPGRAMVNPEWVVMDGLRKAVPALKEWELLEAPPPDPAASGLLRVRNECSRWLNINVLSLDEKRVVVEQGQRSTIDALSRWGFEPIPCPFAHYAIFGGAFHCATLDIRRRSTSLA